MVAYARSADVCYNLYCYHNTWRLSECFFSKRHELAKPGAVGGNPAPTSAEPGGKQLTELGSDPGRSRDAPGVNSAPVGRRRREGPGRPPGNGEGEPAPSRPLPEAQALAWSLPARWFRRAARPHPTRRPRSALRGRRRDSPAALKPKPAGTGECSASSSRMTTSDTLIGQALAGAGPGGLRRGWEAERPAGSAATTSAPPPPRRSSFPSRLSEPQQPPLPPPGRRVPPAWAGARCDWLRWQARGWRGGVALDPSGRDREEVGKEERRGGHRRSFPPREADPWVCAQAGVNRPGRHRLGAPQRRASAPRGLRSLQTVRGTRVASFGRV